MSATFCELQGSAAVAEVFVENRAQLWRVARKIVSTAEVADDVMQDAYLRIADGSCERSVDRPMGYCCQVVRNMALDYCRRLRVESTYRCFDTDVELVDTPALCTPDRRLCERQVIAAIERALAALPKRTRQAFEFHRIEGLTQREIAKRLGCALGLVNSLIAEATDSIRSCGHQLLDAERH
ncbi:sigma-70 family RNA polymerase sigma factor [Paracidovorax wautersii]|uniref:sigma-70 family RNA polymerase sigma factor n=1 Tax=Paracidovorax wautersii TaxID=1177982 RepID=UPI0031DFB242